MIAKDKQAKILVAKERELYFLSYNEEHPVHVVGAYLKSKSF